MKLKFCCIQILSLLIAIFSGLPAAIAQAPSITSFTPESGPVGATVVITGNNFSPVSANNIVFFGAVKASISAASATSLTVTVPSGVTYQPITVNTGGLIAYARKPFIVKFGNGVPGFTSSSFASVLSFPSSGGSLASTIISDFNDDGKPDMATLATSSRVVSVFQNTSATGTVSFAPKMDLNSLGFAANYLEVADLDGDGKNDLVATNGGDNNLVVFKNSSSGGTLSFAPRILISTVSYCRRIAIGDLDNDGKPDIIFTGNSNNSLIVLRNTGSPGTISFSAPVNYTTGNQLQGILIKDIDDDGKQDIAVISAANGGNTVHILRNTTSGTAITFASAITFACNGVLNYYTDNLSAGDIDDDGKPDLVVTNSSSSTVSILRNTSTPGTIAFAAKVDITSPGNPVDAAITDLDGDGKTDIAVTNYSNANCSVFKNNSTPGNIIVAAKVDYVVGIYSYSSSINAGDLDGDGQPDIAMASDYTSSVLVLKNTIAIPVVNSFLPTTGDQGTLVTIRGQKFNTISNVLFGSVPATSFTVVSDTVITATVGQGTSGNVTVSSSTGSYAYLPGFTYSGIVITSFLPTSASTGIPVTIKGANFTNASSVSFGGAAPSSFTVVSDTMITAVVALGATGNVSVTSPVGTATKSGFTYIPLPAITSFTPGSAGITSLITIRGRYFTGTSSVKFGGTAATAYTVVSDTVITATVGTGTSGQVTVTTVYGTGTLGGFTYLSVPVITSFTPLSAGAGASVIISGSNFSSTTSDNIVYFGAVRAVVTAASATSLSVTVPTGARYAPISVTVFGLTTSSLKLFTLSFGGGPITNKSFLQKENFITAGNYDNVVVQDFDGDGKPDVVSAADSLVILRNTSIPKNVSFDRAIAFAPIGHYANKVATGDLDGDGMPDIATGSGPFGNDKLSIFKNTSVTGSISFSQTIISSSVFLYNIFIEDIDKDGRPDILVTHYTVGSPKISVYRNTTVNGVISFAAPLTFSLSVYADYNICVGDMDGDGKMDVVTSNGGGGQVLLLRNTSIPGIISFATMVQFAAGGYSKQTAISDLDGDGKLDIITMVDNFKIVIFRNASSPGSFSFPVRTDIGPEGSGTKCTVADFDGDGKPDMMLLNAYSNSVSFYKNNSNTGTISLSAAAFNWSEYNMADIDNCDMDGDGKTDIVLMNAVLTVLRNVSKEPVINSVSPLNAGAGATVTIKGISFTGTTDVQFSGIPASSYSVVNDTSITAVLAIPFAGNVTITNLEGTGTLNNQFSVPLITALLPDSGTVGSVITVKGANFNLVKDDNIVFFGAVKGAVLSSTDTSLQVVVPKGVLYEPVTVTTHRLTAYSPKPFSLTFRGGDTLLNNISFEAAVNVSVGTFPESIVINDLDSDGIPDLAISTTYYSKILKNHSDSGRLSFTRFEDSTSSQYRYVLGDLNGDGKYDKITSVSTPSVGIRMYRNQTQGSYISFGRVVQVSNTLPFNQSNFYATQTVADIDGNGKPDVISGNNYGTGSSSGTVMVLKNESRDNILAMPPVTGFSTGTPAGTMLNADLDGDGLVDILTLKNVGFNGFTVLRNTGTGGNISFAPRLDSLVSNMPDAFAIGDIDGDKKTDVVLTNGTANVISIFRNTSVPGTISFAPRLDFPAGNGPYGIAIGDLNGDYKKDIVVTNTGDSSISILTNTTSAGNISFAVPINYKTGAQPRYVAIGDLDMDSLPDIAVVNYLSNNISIFRNRQGQGLNLELCNPVGNTSFNAGILGSNYQWQLSTDSVNFNNITDNSNYAGTSSVLLSLSNIPSAWYGNQYRCVVDGQNSIKFTIKFVNRWTGAVNNQWENPGNWSCGAVPDANTDVIINNGTVVLSVSTTIRSLSVGPGVTITINSGVVLTISH